MTISCTFKMAAAVALCAAFGTVNLASAQLVLRGPVAVSNAAAKSNPQLGDASPSAPSVRTPAVADPDPDENAGPNDGPCVLLQNGNVLFGSASQLGDFVIVSRGPGNEIRLPRKEVACWADSLKNLYQYRVDHRVGNTSASHLEVARWCLRYELPELASHEIRSALDLTPGHREALRMQQQVERMMASRRRRDSQLELVANTSAVNSLQPTPIASDVEADEVHPIVLAGFASDIQPMLMNRCGGCHSHTSSRRWRLTTPLPGARVSARMTRANLMAVMTFINQRSPETSELWVKAVTPHGDAVAPLDRRTHKAIAALQSWLASIAAAADAEADAAEEMSPPVPPPAPLVGDTLDADDTIASGPASTRAEARRRRLPSVANPFDPDLFNRQYHPR